MIQYAALGSSFAAGPGLPAGQNYPHRLARLLGADLTDLSVSGATTATILGEQLPGLPTTADLVTVTAGGNDLHYMGSMLYAAWHRVRPRGVAAKMLAAELPDGPVEPTGADVARAAAGLAEIVGRVRERAPRARVLLVDYLTVIGPGTVPGASFAADEIERFRRIQTAVEKAFVLAAAESGAELIAVSQVSREHGLGSAEPWIFPFTTDPATTEGSLHPNPAGMAAVCSTTARALPR
ncbi:lysophospholipase L1-like esterase [Actinoplanes octamycinicus]|uniref:Lysophospholipase L1-like esterase n=1 Tax=Actinoplanes octamycinicus TaxID=135948 RepID=A0A7W7H1R0_9ACTN|nr:SGNH/GDSL hydrolase family protein [Actinoplanes octamycinicus]MBB4742390.1 lysophospholipase L1-like esterase [Actinoplanes octamycinicus]